MFESPTPRLFVAGATGVVGSEVVRQALDTGVAVTPHLRPKTATTHRLGKHPDAAILDLTDAEKLREAMRGHTAVLQLIGTMRHRFATGDTYASSDIGTTRLLLDAAKAAGVGYIVLLGAVMTDTEIGPYLKAKAEAERLVRDSGLGYTIFRPSSFIGGPHKPPPGMDGLLNAIGMVGFGGIRDLFKPIKVEDLARAILASATRQAPRNAILEGASLWEWVAKSER